MRENLRVKEVIVGDGERGQRDVVCHNPDEEKRQSVHRAKLIQQLEAELAAIQQQPGRHTNRACEMLASARFGRSRRQTSTGLLEIDRTAVREAARYDGKWVITTNDDTLTSEDLALGYKQLLCVEQCWRQLESGLKLRPVFHRRPWRVHAHVTLTVLSLLLERIAEIRAGDTWRNIAPQLGAVKLVEYDRGELRVQQMTELPPDVATLLKKWRVLPPPKWHSVEPAHPVRARNDEE